VAVVFTVRLDRDLLTARLEQEVPEAVPGGVPGAGVEGAARALPERAGGQPGDVKEEGPPEPVEPFDTDALRELVTGREETRAGRPRGGHTQPDTAGSARGGVAAPATAARRLLAVGDGRRPPLVGRLGRRPARNDCTSAIG